jgi:hypothetical protein
MIYKLISVQSIIAKVFTDLDLKEGDHRISDMIEWAGEALEKIGAFPQFQNKVLGKDGLQPLTLVDYQAILPYDFHNLIQIGYATSPEGPYYSMRYGTGSFDSGSEITPTGEEADGVSDSDLVILTMDLYNLSYTEALEFLNTNDDKRQLVTHLLRTEKANKSGTTIGTSDYTYVIVDKYIKTNQKDGYLMVAYQAIPTDADGYPLVPDRVSYREAIYWYINMKLMYVQWKLGQVRDAVYYDARRSWNYYCKQAYGDAMMPNQEQMESIKNTWLRMVPELGEHEGFFTTLGQRQILYNQDNSSYHGR